MILGLFLNYRNKSQELIKFTIKTFKLIISKIKLYIIFLYII